MMGKTDGFKVRVGVILLHQQTSSETSPETTSKLLLVRQNERPFWVFPGGTLEPGEGLAAGGIREMQEELNLTGRLHEWSYLADFFHPKRQVVDVFFQGIWESGELKMTLDENLNDVGWFTQSELRAMDVRPNLVKNAVLEDWEGLTSTSAPSPNLGRYLGCYSPEA
jgi:8-oxo-dGTP pyrophosphatase MutT (NUDIX family)